MTAGGILVYGEALADLVPQDADAAGYDAVLGGSGFNTALALARCGAKVALCASLSDDALGRRFRERLATEGIDGLFLTGSPAPTPLAMVEPIGADGSARYHFHLAETAFAASPELPDSLDGFAHLHLTSFAATTGDSGTAALALMRRARAAGLSVSYDPNIRPPALPERDVALRVITERVALSDVVKLSAEDADWLRGGRAESPALGWLAAGLPLLLETAGAEGATLHAAEGIIASAPAPATVVVDTIGAGDAFIGGFLAALMARGALGARLRRLDAGTAQAALAFAIRVAAATCERRGCDPPRLSPDAERPLRS